MAVGNNIKKRRKDLKMSQQHLADVMGYKTRSTIAKIESGENDVSQRKLQKFAAVLNTTVEFLISGSAASPESKMFNSSISNSGARKNIAVILAGGASAQNSQNIPTQFVNVHSKPIIVYSMELYQNHPAIDAIYIVCLHGWEAIVKAYAIQHNITKLKGFITAGKNGITSLKNAITYISKHYSQDDNIIVQEATRPLVTPESLSALLKACEETGSAISGHSMKEYVQFSISGNKTSYIDRKSTIALQSPEAHRLRLINEVFEKAHFQKHPLTESCCAMLLYNLGYNINFIENSFNNIKIACDEDITIFSTLTEK